MTTPGDESRTELAWREIVENYGERPVLDDGASGDAASGRPTTPAAAPSPDPGSRPGRDADVPSDPTSDPTADLTSDLTSDLVGDLPEDLVDDDEVEAREQRAAEAERFRPPPAPPFPRPRTWQRAVAWAGIFVSPLLALVVGLLSVYVPPLLGWVLVTWFVGGFVYLVREMPRSPRDPWDDGSRI